MPSVLGQFIDHPRSDLYNNDTNKTTVRRNMSVKSIQGRLAAYSTLSRIKLIRETLQNTTAETKARLEAFFGSREY